MQNGNSDKIQQLIEAARAEERAKLEVATILREIHEKLTEVERTTREQAQSLHRARTAIDANYININTLIQLVAAIWQGDKSHLSEIQQRLAEQAFAHLQREADITVEAGGDVSVNADRVGRDKKGKENDEKKE